MSDKIKIKSPKEVGKIISSLRAEGMTDGSIRETLIEAEKEFELDDNLFSRAEGRGGVNYRCFQNIYR